MKTMLEPAMVATKTHGLTVFSQGDASPAPRITPSSQGLRVTNVMESILPVDGQLITGSK
jgi:hypothetical protein